MIISLDSFEVPIDHPSADVWYVAGHTSLKAIKRIGAKGLGVISIKTIKLCLRVNLPMGNKKRTKEEAQVQPRKDQQLEIY